MRPSSSSQTAGFTLIEMAVSITIIALIISVITGATAMRRNYQLITLMDGASKITQATIRFKEIYGGLPGDLWNAQDKFGTTAPDGNAINNGDGNGWISSTAEANYAPQHLMLAGLIDGHYTGILWSASNMMTTSVSNSAFFFVSQPASTTVMITPSLGFGGSNTLSLGTGSPLTGGGYLGSIITAQEMSRIDTKYDDGVPNSYNDGVLTSYTSTGKINGYDGTESGHIANSCVNSAGTAYATTGTANACYFKLSVEGVY